MRRGGCGSGQDALARRHAMPIERDFNPERTCLRNLVRVKCAQNPYWRLERNAPELVARRVAVFEYERNSILTRFCEERREFEGAVLGHVERLPLGPRADGEGVARRNCGKQKAPQGY